jgi:phospholipase/carboxylesterase
MASEKSLVAKRPNNPLTKPAPSTIPSAMPILDGPRLLPQHGKPQQLVLLLHGFGADGNDLIGLASEWQPLLPQAEFLSPHAPFPCEAAPFGRQWFGFQGRTREQVLEGVKQAATILDQFITEVLAERGIDETKLALVGFSQGAMMSLYVSLRRAKPVAGVVAYSGRLFAAEALAVEMKSKPKILLVHGDADQVVEPESHPHALSALQAAGVAVEGMLRPGLGHGIDAEGLSRGGEFLKAAFGI